MINTLKNWWFALAGMAVVILDQGFEVLNPFLVEIGLPSKLIGGIKVVFGLYAIYNLKNSLPTQNPEKLDDLAQKIATPRVPKKN